MGRKKGSKNKKKKPLRKLPITKGLVKRGYAYVPMSKREIRRGGVEKEAKRESIREAKRKKLIDKQLELESRPKKLKRVSRYDTAAIKESVSRTGKELFRTRDRYGRKKSKQRQMATRKVLGAMGIIAGGGQAGPGRPRGTYKHGMPIHVYKAMLRDRALKQQVYQQQKLRALSQRGISPEQYQQMQVQRTAQQPRQFEQTVQKQMPQDDGGYRETPEQIRAQVDDEVAFRRWAKDRTISPTTRNILIHLMRTQNRARSDDIEMQRRIMEKKMIADQSNLMRARNLFGPDSKTFDILEEQGNILQAENTFKENGEHILDTHGRPNILQTKQAGNSLWGNNPEEEMRRKMEELRRRRRR